MYDAISMEERDRPTAAIINDGFLNDARSAASSRGMPWLRVVPEGIVGECSIVEEIEAGVEAVWEDIVAALTGPLREEERSPRALEPEAAAGVAFSGTLEEVNRFFYRRGWGDGLPVIPPTEGAVAEMLTGTDLPPGHLVAELGPRAGKATVEKIAVNAVMAGALPTHLPLIIAGVQALLSYPEYGYLRYGVSTGSWAPLWIINGPVRKDVQANSGTGALSPGDIANAAIGRAMGLVLKNIGGIRKGIEDMGTLGNPGKYSLVIAENEEDSPWDPLHVEYGFGREHSTISLSFPNNCVFGAWPQGSDDEGILRHLMYNLRGGAGCLVFTPVHAKTLAQAGWTKRTIKEFLAEYARVPGAHLAKGIPSQPSGLWGNRVPIRETDQVPIVRDIGDLAIIVAGGPGAHIGQLMGGVRAAGGSFSCWGKTTTKVQLPGNWRKLVAKYGMAPAYVRY